MLRRLRRAFTAGSGGGHPLTTQQHDGVCFVLRSQTLDVVIPYLPSPKLSLTLANHPALPASLDEESFAELRAAYARKATVAEDPVIDWLEKGGGGESFWESGRRPQSFLEGRVLLLEKLEERVGGRARTQRTANVVFYADEAAGRLISMELPRGEERRFETFRIFGEGLVTLQTLPNTHMDFSVEVVTRKVPADRVVAGR